MLSSAPVSSSFLLYAMTITLTSAAQVQALYTWRCYMVCLSRTDAVCVGRLTVPQILNRKPWIPVLLFTAVLASVGLHIHATYELIHIGPAPGDTGMTPQRNNRVPTCTSLECTMLPVVHVNDTDGAHRSCRSRSEHRSVILNCLLIFRSFSQ